MAVVLLPEQAARMVLEAAVSGPLGMRPTHVLKQFTLRQMAMDLGVHLDDFPRAVEYAVQQGWLEALDGAFVRLTEFGFAVASSGAAAIQPPEPSDTETSRGRTVTVSSEGQSSGITANEVHFHGPTTIHGPGAPPSPVPIADPTPEPRKSWWKSWWAITSGAAIILAGLVPTLEYMGIEWPRLHKSEAVRTPPAVESAPAPKPPEATQAIPIAQLAPVEGSRQQSLAKPAAQSPPMRSPKRTRVITNAPSVVNSVGTVYNNSGIIAPGATGSITQHVQGYMPPPLRVITDEQLGALVARLQTAPPGSIARLNFAASDDNTEVHAFFTQVETAFKRADHWKASVQIIGKSMGTADGSTLTAEGIGCTVAGDHGGVAVDAMAAAGFPCTRKAADWGIANPPPSDVVISIGSRIIPPQ